jgi:FMN phosphatase YigB (HAD superfamily)
MKTIIKGVAEFIRTTTSDIEASQRASMQTILLRTSHAESEAKYPSNPDYISPNLPLALN